MSSVPPIIPSDVAQTAVPNHGANGPDGTGKADKGGKSLPKLPIPKLEDSCRRYLKALEGLQDEEEHAKTKAIVKDFLASGEGHKWQKKLEEYDQGVDSYIEEFWCESPSLKGAASLADMMIRRELSVSRGIRRVELGGW